MKTLSDDTDGTVSLHIRSATSSGQAARLALNTVLRRKGRVLDAISNQIMSLRSRLDPQDRVLFEHLSASRARLAALVLNGPGKLPPEQHQAAITKVEAEVEHLEATISARSAEFRAQAQPVTLAHVQETLPADAALVELASYRPFNVRARTRAGRRGPARYVAYVLRREGAPLFVELGEAATIDRDVMQLRATLGDSQLTDLPKIKRLARALDERVMRPVRRLLGGARHVFISPDGALNLVPFAALMDEQNRYLVENYSITYLTSGRDLLRLREQTANQQEAVIVADPAFDQAITTGRSAEQSAEGVRGRRAGDFRDEKWSALPATKTEAAEIKALLPDARVLTATEATEAALKRVAQPRILHIASHGFFLEDKPAADIENPLLRSGLILAGANQRQSGAGEDGVLTALEAAGLNLWGTKLIVLSACETGLGSVSNGEGVYGLRRALVLAGAESQVLSLWKVQDEATRYLMVDFYRRLQRGEGRTEALRQAQLALLRGKRMLRRHPYYWAGFIQSGDWQPMNAK